MRHVLSLVFVSIMAVSVSAQQRPAWAAGTGIRTERSRPDTVIPLTLKMRYTTMVFLPDDEEILLDDCGDRDSWNIVSNHNMLSIAPKLVGADTNLNVITKSGSVFSFTLKEGGKGQPDLKVFVTVPEDRAPVVRKFYTVAEYEAGIGQVSELRGQVNELRTALEATRQEAEAKAAAVKLAVPARFHFDYKPVKDEAPFKVKAVFHDGTFTYIQAGAREKFSIYETMDGKPNAINAQVENGTYIIPKVAEALVLVLGSSRLPIVMKAGAGH